jgi:methyltransferase (TIGR00027 family)
VTRTDNDTWDLASSVGATATMVAASRALAAQGPDPLIDDPFAAPPVRAVGITFFTDLVNGDVVVGSEDPEMDPRKMAEQVTVRTRFFDDFFLDATGAGIRQAVILASGLDARAYRLPWPEGTVVFEVDQPQVIEFKTATMAELGATPAADHRTVAIDLRGDWMKALRDNGFDDGAPTAWIAEGLLVYLRPEAQDRLFDNIAALSAPCSRLATEFIPDLSPFSDGRSEKIKDRWRRHGVDLDLSDLIYHGQRSHVLEYLTQLGWLPAAQTTAQLYTVNGFIYPEDELMAAFADVTYVSATLK